MESKGLPTGSAPDTVVPFRYFDNQKHFSQFVLVVTFRVDHVLDADKLRDALRRLMTIGNWRELGARVRRNSRGDLEYHLPHSYDDDRPGFRWSQVKFDQSIAEHPLGSRLPRAAPDESGPQFFDDGEVFRSLVEPSDMPRKIEDWTSTDSPLLSLHMVSFGDATLLTVGWCHSFMDGVGLASFMKAWTAVLAGREDEVPPLLSITQDPVQMLDSNSQPALSSYILRKSMLKGGSFIMFALNQLWDMIWAAKPEGRTICLPQGFVADLKARTIQELRSEDRTGGENDEHFLSEGDVLSAWIMRLAVTAQQIPGSRPIAMSNVIDTRGLVDGVVLPPSTAYTGNLCILFSTFPRACDLQKESLGATALRLRRTLEEQRTREQFEGYVALHRQNTAAGRLTLFGPWNMVMMNMSNWHKARFYELDFSPAIVRVTTEKEAATAEGERGEPNTTSAKPSYINVQGHENVPIPSTNVGPLIGRDAKGDWWMTWRMKRDAWDRFIQLAKEFS